MERRKDYVDVYGRFKEGRAFCVSPLLGLLNTSGSNYFEEQGGGKTHAGTFKVKDEYLKSFKKLFIVGRSTLKYWSLN